MVLALTIFSVPVACIAAVILRIRKVRLAYIWLILFTIAVLTLLTLIFSAPVSAEPFTIQKYFKAGNEEIDIIFQLNIENRIAGIGVFVLMMAYLATETASPHGNQSLSEWITTLLFSTCAWVVLLAGNSWTVLIGWTILDMFEIVKNAIYHHISSQHFLSFYFTKFLGSIALVYVISGAYQSNPNNLIGGTIKNMGIWILVSVLLHGGVLPLVSAQENRQKTDIHLRIIEILLFISHCFLLTQVPGTGLSPIMRLVLKVITLSGAIFSAIRSIIDSRGERRFGDLVATFAFLTGYAFISENQVGVLYFLLSSVPICWLYLFGSRSRKHFFIWIIYLFFLTGFPFSIYYAAINSLVMQNQILESIAIGIPLALVNASLFKRMKETDKKSSQMQKINEVFYTLGLILPLGGIILIIIENHVEVSFRSLWYGGMQIGMVVLFLWIKGMGKKKQENRHQNISIPKQFSIKQEKIGDVFSLANSAINNTLHFIAKLFEEDGGILWALVFLSLLLTILRSQGGSS